jgi:drug/metabolite transporter (DMT)-like permease
MALAFIIPLGVYVVSKPGRSSRQGQIFSALVLLGAALILGAGVHNYAEGRSPILQLVSGAGLIVAGVSVLRKNRRYTPL